MSILIYIADLSYNLCQAFWTPGLPLLARNTPESVQAKQEYASGDITEDEYQGRVMLQRNKLSNYAFGAMSIGYTLTLIIALGAAFGLHANDSTQNNIRAAVVIVGIATGVWIVFGTPWFFIEKNRSNKLEMPLPDGSGKQSTFAEARQYIVTGLKVYWNVLKHIPHLTQTWLYLVGFFLISDGFATTNQIYGIAQNTIVSYSTTTSTELYIVQGFSNLVGIAVFWLIQRHFRIRTKTILIVNCIFVILNAVWGMSRPITPVCHFFWMNTDMQQAASVSEQPSSVSTIHGKYGPTLSSTAPSPLPLQPLQQLCSAISAPKAAKSLSSPYIRLSVNRRPGLDLSSPVSLLTGLEVHGTASPLRWVCRL